MLNTIYDAVIVGGGFYGCQIALFLKAKFQFEKILIIEQESSIMKRASLNNQARIHQGYHYPRSYTTAYRCRNQASRFVSEFPGIADESFVHLYGISSRSKVNSNQFTRFCNSIDAYYKKIDSSLFPPLTGSKIDDVFKVKEYIYNARLLAQIISNKLLQDEINIIFNNQAISIAAFDKPHTELLVKDLLNNIEHTIKSDFVFNCTYSGLNNFDGKYIKTQQKLKHEIAEIAIIKLPDEWRKLGLTVMDGPFFSILPLPNSDLHSFSHVRHTPHCFWIEDTDGIPILSPYQILENYNKESRFDYMIRDASKYIPSLKSAEYQRSIFEIKTLMSKSEIIDSRPILLEKNQNIPRFFSILGGKIDNIYDALDALSHQLSQYVDKREPCT